MLYIQREELPFHQNPIAIVSFVGQNDEFPSKQISAATADCMWDTVGSLAPQIWHREK